MTHLLSINFSHDGAGAILSDGRLTAYVNTERFSRKKKHPGLRACDLHELLAQANLELADIGHAILSNLGMQSPDIPATHGTDLSETWLPFEVDAAGTAVVIEGRRIPCTLNPPHHLLHCALVYYTSPFDSAVLWSADPTGCGAYLGQGRTLSRIDGPALTHAASYAYTQVAIDQFGTGLLGAGKVMGLAPYGQPATDGIDYRSLTTMEELYALAGREPIFVDEAQRRLNASLAYHVQRVLEVQLCDTLGFLHAHGSRTGVPPNVGLCGGTALNSVANQIAFTSSGFERIHLHPACGDDGTAIGAALWHWHGCLGRPRRTFTNAELMYSVRSYDDAIDACLERHRDRLKIDEPEDYLAAAAALIAEGQIVGWFEGASEIGPRALGHRSILADPRRPDMKDRLNSRVKFREGFRPFAPAVLNEHAEEWFGLRDSPFMLRVCQVRRTGIPAVTHVDGTARIQTVAAADNPAFHALLTKFHARTGVPIILNTSFNIAGEPIVETPDDAIAALLKTELDGLVFPRRIVRKR